MKRLSKLRNFGIIAHVDAGKTTVAEHMLVHAGRVRAAGRIDDGNTSLDFTKEERDRGITIESAATRFDWSVGEETYSVNFVDTPGHVDFSVEVERALRVLDGAIVVVSGVAGVEPQTETVWRQADHYALPRVVFVNKLDLAGADMAAVVDEISTRFSCRAVALQSYDGELSDIVATAGAERDALLEVLSEFDDAILAALIREESIPDEVAWSALRSATISGEIVPVFGGSALKDLGVSALLDGAVRLLPSPDDRARTFDVGGHDDLVALVFKRLNDKYAGKLSFVRVYRGTLKRGDQVMDAGVGKSLRVGRLVRVHADQREEVDVLAAGEIGAVLGIDVRSGATLASVDAPVVLEDLRINPPVVWMNVEPKRSADRANLSFALGELIDDDPSIAIRHDDETGQTLVGGQGELQLEIVASKLERLFEVDALFGEPEVAYRETITTEVTLRHRLKKQTGGPGMFAELELSVQPAPRGDGLTFVNEISGGAIPADYVSAVERGIRRSVETGGESGYPITDLVVRLLDGLTHRTDSSAIAFERAAADALRLAVSTADPIRLEPMMTVTVRVPDDYVGSVIGELERRRSRVVALARGEADGLQVIETSTPLAETFGLMASLRSASKGRASYHAQFSHYQ